MRWALIALIGSAIAATARVPSFHYTVSLNIAPNTNTFDGEALIVPATVDRAALHVTLTDPRNDARQRHIMSEDYPVNFNQTTVSHHERRADREVADNNSQNDSLSDLESVEHPRPASIHGNVQFAESYNHEFGVTTAHSPVPSERSSPNASFYAPDESTTAQNIKDHTPHVLSELRRKRSFMRQSIMLGRQRRQPEPSHQSSIDTKPPSIVFHNIDGAHLQFTLGPKLTVKAVQLLVRNTPAELERQQSWQYTSLTIIQSRINRALSMRSSLMESGNGQWHEIPSVYMSTERGVYAVRAVEERLNLEQLALADRLAIKVYYSGPAVDISADMDPRDVEAHLWRGAVWRLQGEQGRTVYGATAAAAAGRLGHVARLMPVMRMSGGGDAAGMPGQEAPMTEISISVHHPSTHALHASSPPDLSLQRQWRGGFAVSTFTVECGSRSSVLPANVGWVLLPPCAKLPLRSENADIETGHGDETQAILFVPYSATNTPLPPNAQVVLERALGAEAAVTSAPRTSSLHVIVLPQLAYALRTVAPENVVFVHEVAPTVVARATALCTLLWRNYAMQRVQPTPWLLEGMAAHIVNDSADRQFSIGRALAADDLREHALEALSVVDDAAAAKGASILQMLTCLTGRQTFNDVVLRGDTPLTAEDLSRRIEQHAVTDETCQFPFTPDAKNADMAPFEFVLPWATHPSMPMVVVHYEDGNIVLSQRPVNPAAAGAVWPIPIIVYVASSGPVVQTPSETLSAQIVLFADILLDQPVSVPIEPKMRLRLLNAGRTDGFYRVHYTARAVQSGLFSFHPTSPGASEAADDAFALALNRCITIDDALELVQAMLSSTFVSVPGARLGVLRFVRANLDALHLALRGDERGMRRHLRDLTRDVVRMVSARNRFDDPRLQSMHSGASKIDENLQSLKQRPDRELSRFDCDYGTLVSPPDANADRSRHSLDLGAMSDIYSDSLAEGSLLGAQSIESVARVAAGNEAVQRKSRSLSSVTNSTLQPPGRGTVDSIVLTRLRALSREHLAQIKSDKRLTKSTLRRGNNDSQPNITLSGALERRSGKARLARMSSMLKSNGFGNSYRSRSFKNVRSAANVYTHETPRMTRSMSSFRHPSMYTSHKSSLYDIDDLTADIELIDLETPFSTQQHTVKLNSQTFKQSYTAGRVHTLDVDSDPLLADSGHIWKHLGGGLDEDIDDETQINRLLFDMRLQTGDIVAVATAQRLFEQHVAGVARLSSYDNAAAMHHEVRNELLDNVLRAARIYGDRRAYIMARDLASGWRRPGDSFRQRLVRRLSKQSQKTAKTVSHNPAVVPRAVKHHIAWWVAYNLWMFQMFILYFLWGFIKTISAGAPHIANAWAAWDSLTTAPMARLGYSAGCATDFDPAYSVLPYLVLFVWRTAVLLYFYSQSYYMINGQAAALDALSEALVLRQLPSDWARTAHERADPAAWIDADISYVGASRTLSIPPESSYQARARAVNEQRRELEELNNDWQEAGEQKPTVLEPDDMMPPNLRV